MALKALRFRRYFKKKSSHLSAESRFKRVEFHYIKCCIALHYTDSVGTIMHVKLFSKLPALSIEIAALFKLSNTDARRAASIFTEVAVTSGTELAWEGTGFSQLVLILEGEVEVVRDGEVIALLGPGSVLGEITTLGITREQTASATMRTAGRVAAAGSSDVAKLRECTGLYLHLQHLASKRIAAANLAK